MTGVSDPADRRRDNSAELRISAGPLSAPVLCRVVSMMLARADCPLDRLEDAMLVCDAVCAHALPHVQDGALALRVAVRPHRLELRIGELSQDGARGLLHDAVLPGIGNVLEHMSDELEITAAVDGNSAELLLAMSFD